MADFKPTPEQEAAATNRGGSLLVSAAAGSGKTRVLVERLLGQVAEGCNIDQFLVITFTNAAAAELRTRIAAGLSKRLAAQPDSRHLRRQTTLVYQAQISTIHAFCKVFLRECGHLIDLDPDFRLCDGGEEKVYQQRAMDVLLEDAYATLTPSFTALLDMLSHGRDDSRVSETVLDMFNKIQSHPDPMSWLEEQRAQFSMAGVTDVADTPWGGYLLADAREEAAYWEKRLTPLLSQCRVGVAAYADSLAETVTGLNRLACATRWDQAVDSLPIFPRLGSSKNCEDPDLALTVKALRERCKKRMERLAGNLGENSATLLADMKELYPAVCGLLDLVGGFAQAYEREKTRRSVLDFSDLEHKTLALLTQHPDLAAQWGARYHEIMVDEYQDTNEVQNVIFNALSKGGERLFMVGDVKQSIYRFRLADPTIFLKKYQSFAPWQQAVEGKGRKVLLGQNFRSRHQVLEGANYLFRNLMSTALGEMEYGPEEALIPGATLPDTGGDHRVELDVIDLSQLEAGEEGKTERRLIEARFVARRLRTLLDENAPVVEEGGTIRPAQPRDMVVLLRSPGPALHHYARALSEAGIPWEAEGGEDFFHSPEVAVALGLLEIIDNPRQDVPLLAVLRSPIVGFSADRLAQLRAAHPQGTFYDSLVADGGADCLAFLGRLDTLRLFAGEKGSYALLWDVFLETNLLAIYTAMEDGQRRRGNLLALYECARHFEGSGYKGLFPFLTHLKRLREAEQTLTAPGTSAGLGVRLLSIHRSKGLEFPIVVVGGLAGEFNRQDATRPVLFHPRLGVGPKGLDMERVIEYPTIARRAVALALDREMMAEELRLLYVAMTRAKEKLIMTCTLRGGRGDLDKYSQDATLPVEPRALAAAQSVGQWVLTAALARPDGEALHSEAYLPHGGGDFGPAWDIRLIDGTAYEAGEHQERVGQQQKRLEHPLPDYRWQYPHAAETQTPSKLTATQLKGRGLDSEVEEEAPHPPHPMLFDRPSFAAETMGLSPGERGTAHHLVMQYLDFSRTGSLDALRGEISRLTENAIITPQQGEAVDPAVLMAFFTSPLGRDVLAAPKLEREFKFSILVSAADHYPAVGVGEQVLLQGVVDCWFDTKDGLVVVDFKSDRVTLETVAARSEDYRPQLGAYAAALAEMTGRPVCRRMLWFFSLGLAVEVSPP